jgi:TDG/mug DNA glycosylase family protein
LLPDIVAPDLRIVFVGINPGLASEGAGCHYAHARNCFWRALYASGLTPRLLVPREQWLLLQLGMGLTNAVHRATAGSAQLRRADYVEALPRLTNLAATLKPQWLAFVGKQAYAPLWPTRRPVTLGEQSQRVAGSRVFVLPSTSPANAGYSELEKTAWFARLRAVLNGK